MLSAAGWPPLWTNETCLARLTSPSHSSKNEQQLAALGRIHELFVGRRIEYWLFGGWAVDFHAGRVTRHHSDLDIAVWLTDMQEIAALLAAEGWKRESEEGQDGYVSYKRMGLTLEVAFLARGDDGDVYTPLSDGRAGWPQGAFGGDLMKLRGRPARVMSLAALRADKAEEHEDPKAAAKDRADLATLELLP